MPLPQFSMNNIPQDQIDDEPIGFTISIPPLRNQAMLATPDISVSATQYFLTMNSPMLSSKLTALKTKMRVKMMVIKSYFKNELQ